MDEKLIPILRGGASLGLKTGLALSLLYIIGYVIFTSINFLFTLNKDLGDRLTLIAIMAPVTFSCGIVIGILPGVVLGMFTGSVINLILSLLKHHLSKFTAVIIGGLVSVIIVIAIHIILQLRIDLPSEPGTWASLGYKTNPMRWGYLIFFGIPSIIYVIAGGWVSKRLYEQLLTKLPNKDIQQS